MSDEALRLWAHFFGMLALAIVLIRVLRWINLSPPARREDDDEFETVRRTDDVD
jgi:cbb3-type cytochrome oxidase subunit 3